MVSLAASKRDVIRILLRCCDFPQGKIEEGVGGLGGKGRGLRRRLWCSMRKGVGDGAVFEFDLPIVGSG